ncbi:MAG: hypothetical protein HGA41_04295 [Syntrophaceae bacterium]|nr:hypothetical protein [Syntrophaceae bacterium]
MYQFILLGAIFIAYIFSWVMNLALSKIPSKNIRLIFPLLIVLILSLISQMVSYIFEYEASLLIFTMFLPTAGIFALSPFLESYINKNQLNPIRICGSIVFTAIFFLYQLLGLESGGILSILIPFYEIMPIFGAYLIYFFEVCVITAVFVGGLILCCKISRVDYINKYQVLATIALIVFSYFILQPLIIGILAVFAYTMIRGNSRSLVVPPLLLLCSIIVSAVTVYPLSTSWVGGLYEYYSYSILTLGLMTPATIAVIPLYERFSRIKWGWEIPIFLVSSVGTCILAISVSESGITTSITSAISILTDAIYQASSISFDSGIVFCIFLIVGIVIITAALYGIVTLLLTHWPILNDHE